MTSSLPSHRQVLSSLITAVCQPPPSSPSSTTSPPPSRNPSLQATIPPSRRQFLLTLHVLFPTLLLPALDLLDRELITCLYLASRTSHSGDKLYIVKSLASTLKHKRGGGGSAAKPQGKYVVTLAAWNCTCASFALEAYGGGTQHGGPAVGATSAEDRAGDLEAEHFGGLSLDGARAGRGRDVPCCKHLLACLLAENWGSLIGGRVDAREASREEMAGVIASI